MADKTTDQLVELTTLDANDLLIAYDVSEVGTEKIKKITTANAMKVGYIKAARNTSQTIPANASPYPLYTVAMTSTEFSSSVDWTINGSGEVVIPAGVSLIHVIGNVYWATNSVGSRQLGISKNGTGQGFEAYFDPQGTDANQVVGMLQVSSGDRIALGVRQDCGGGTLNVVWGKFCVYQIV